MLGKIIEKFNQYLKKRIIILFILFCCVNIIAVLPSFNHISEILSHFKLHYFYAGLIFLLFFAYLSSFIEKYKKWIAVSLIITLINFVDLYPYFIRPVNAGNKDNIIKIALYNVLTSNKNYNLPVNEVNDEIPDIVILQEVDDTWLSNIELLRNQYPYYIEHPRDDNFGIALYSKYPFIDSKIEEWTEYQLPVVNSKININGEIINMYAVHTLPPLSIEGYKIRNKMFMNINKIITENKENLIIAGDFNSTSFSHSYKKYIKSTKIKDAQTICGNIHEGSWNTYHPPFLRVTLEHILMSNNINSISYKQGKFFGSDHFPVFVEMSL